MSRARRWTLFRFLYAFFRRSVRLLVGLWILLVCLGVLAAVAVKVYVTPEALKSRIIAELEQTFQRPVRIRHVTLVLHQGIKVSGLEVSDSPESPDSPFLFSDFLLVTVKLSPLLQGKIELSRVLLMSPRIHVVRRKDGTWNFSSLLEALAKRAPRKGRLSLPPLEAADRISIERGTVVYEDLTRDLSLVFEDLGLNADRFSLDAPFAVRFGFRNSSRVAGKAVQAVVSLEGNASLGRFRLESAALAAEKLSLRLNGQPFQVSGTVRNFLRPALNLQIDAPRLTSETLSPYGAVPPGIDFPASRWELRAEPAPGEGLARVFHIGHLGFAANGLRLASFGNVDFAKGRFRLKLQTPGLPLEKVIAVYPGWGGHGIEGTAAGSVIVEGPYAKPSLAQVALQLRGFAMSFKNQKRMSKMDLSIRAEEGLKTWELRAAKGTYVAYANALSDVDVSARIDKGNMAVPRLAVTWNGSRIDLRGCVEHLAAPKAVYFDGTVDSLRSDELYSAIMNLIELRRAEKGEAPGPKTSNDWSRVFKYAIPEKFPDLIGRLKVQRAHSPNFDTQSLDVVCDIKNISKGLTDVDGHFTAGFGPGRISNIPTMQKAHPLLNVLLLPFVEMQKIERKAVLSLDTAVPLTLDFTRTYGDFGVNDGIVDVRYVHFDSNQFLCFADGRVDFPKEGLDLHVLLRIPKPRGNLPFHLTDTKGRPAIDLSLKKNLNDPDMEFNSRKMGDNDIEDSLAGGFKRAAPFAPLEEKLSCGMPRGTP